MKLSYIDKFIDWISNTPLFELAQQRSIAIDKIEDLSETLNEHLFKLYIMQKSTYRDHWVDEIHNYLFKINNITWGKKRNKFEESDYFDWLFKYFFYDNKNQIKINLNRNLKKLLDNYPNEEKIKWTLNEFKNISNDFHSYFSKKLESGTYDAEDLEKYIENRLKF
jgi:hypothetical protein